jgi:hypothetical protein
MGLTLLVLAAGMGSRFGGPKQLERFGPGGETMMDYAIYDALAAGFDRVVFVIRRALAAEFRAGVGSRYERRIAVDYVFQEMDDLPAGFVVPAGRRKPWGTAHAIWSARTSVREPFANVNADDYYGKNAFRVMAQHLQKFPMAGSLPEYCVVGYPVRETLSDHGGVARAICEIDDQGFLVSLTERFGLKRAGERCQYVDEAGDVRILRGDEVVSMNMMGFAPTVFAQLERHLAAFLEGRGPSRDGEPEFLLPEVVGKLIAEKTAQMRVLPTTDTWFGVTYAQDKPAVTKRLAEMVKQGDYPSPIWQHPVPPLEIS